MIEGQLELAQAGQCFIAHLMIDVAAVGRFEPGVLETLLPIRYRVRERGVALHLSGCAGRAHRLPRYVREALAAFNPFVTATVPEQR